MNNEYSDDAVLPTVSTGKQIASRLTSKGRGQLLHENEMTGIILICTHFNELKNDRGITRPTTTWRRGRRRRWNYFSIRGEEGGAVHLGAFAKVRCSIGAKLRGRVPREQRVEWFIWI